MTIIDRYVGRSVLVATGVVALVVGALVLLIAFINEIEDVGEGSYGLLEMMMTIALMLPDQIRVVLPVIVLLGALSGLGTLAANSELIVIRGAGVSMRRLVASVGWAALILALVGFAISAYLGPMASRAADVLKQEATTGHSGRANAHGMWLRQGNAVLHLEAALPGGRVRGVTLYRLDDRGRLQTAIAAPAGHIENGALLLDNPRRTQISLQRIRTQAPARLRVALSLNREIIDLAVSQPNQLTILGLWRYSRFLRANHVAATTYELALWRRVVMPVTVWTLAIFALPFAFGALRGAGAGQRLFVGGIGGFGFVLVNNIVGSTAPVYGLAPWLAASLPTAVLALATAWWIRRLS